MGSDLICATVPFTGVSSGVFPSHFQFRQDCCWPRMAYLNIKIMCLFFQIGLHEDVMCLMRRQVVSKQITSFCIYSHVWLPAPQKALLSFHLLYKDLMLSLKVILNLIKEIVQLNLFLLLSGLYQTLSVQSKF